MARNVLVIGGTRFFGKKLVQKLINNGDRVTVASRNLTRGGFGPEVNAVTIERENTRSMEEALKDSKFDLVFDQICYSPSAAADLCRILEGRTDKLIYTSSQSIYISSDLQKEGHFDASNYGIKMGYRNDFDYGEGKRLAEAVYAQRASFPVTSVRFPYVLGSDDYLGRLEFHIERVKAGKSIVAQNPTVRTSFIKASEAADFLFWVADHKINGAVNACSLGEASLQTVLDLVEKYSHQKAVLRTSGSQEETSPYNQSCSRFMDVSKGTALGFQFSHLNDWLPALVQALC